ncbi:MAG: very short patch repair endonuclease [Chloroflexota bacterium]
MVDNLKPADRRKTMQAVKGKNTRLERRFFSILAAMRLNGWKKNAADVVGKPDVVFPTRRVAIFVDGCFWHGCPHCCRKLPATNRKYWRRKIRRNVALAQSTNHKLRNAGWTVIRIWEHALQNPKDLVRIKTRLDAVVKETKRNAHKSRKGSSRKSPNP